VGFLEWSTKWGAHASKIAEAARDRGVPVPANAIAPELGSHLDSYVHIFWLLRTCALNGMSVGRIPWTAIDTYAERYGLLDDEVQYDDLVYVIMAMDSRYVELCAEESDKKSKQDAGSESNLKPTKW
jgi:hypothetical protein